MILVIPTIYLMKGKSQYSIYGLPEFEKLESHFKNNPLELARLFREENNKSLLIHIDDSLESLNIANTIQDILDIPIQLITNTTNIDFLSQISKSQFSRLFTPVNNAIKLPIAIPIIKLSDISDFNFESYDRVMVDFENAQFKNIEVKGSTKLSIINSVCTTPDLVEINKISTNIDSVYLGKDYYGVHFAGQILWRLAEKAQFAI